MDNRSHQMHHHQGMMGSMQQQQQQHLHNMKIATPTNTNTSATAATTMPTTLNISSNLLYTNIFNTGIKQQVQWYKFKSSTPVINSSPSNCLSDPIVLSYLSIIENNIPCVWINYSKHKRSDQFKQQQNSNVSNNNTKSTMNVSSNSIKNGPRSSPILSSQQQQTPNPTLQLNRSGNTPTSISSPLQYTNMLSPSSQQEINNNNNNMMVDDQQQQQQLQYKGEGVELWVFDINNSIGNIESILVNLNKIDSGKLEITSINTNPFLTTLLFKSLFNILEHKLISNNYIKIGNSFIKKQGTQLTQRKNQTKDIYFECLKNLNEDDYSELSYSFSFFLSNNSILFHLFIERKRIKNLQKLSKFEYINAPIITTPNCFIGYLKDKQHEKEDPNFILTSQQWKQLFNINLNQRIINSTTATTDSGTNNNNNNNNKNVKTGSGGYFYYYHQLNETSNNNNVVIDRPKSIELYGISTLSRGIYFPTELLYKYIPFTSDQQSKFFHEKLQQYGLEIQDRSTNSIMERGLAIKNTVSPSSTPNNTLSISPQQLSPPPSSTSTPSPSITTNTTTTSSVSSSSSGGTTKSHSTTSGTKSNSQSFIDHWNYQLPFLFIKEDQPPASSMSGGNVNKPMFSPSGHSPFPASPPNQQLHSPGANMNISPKSPTSPMTSPMDDQASPYAEGDNKNKRPATKNKSNRTTKRKKDDEERKTTKVLPIQQQSQPQQTQPIVNNSNSSVVPNIQQQQQQSIQQQEQSIPSQQQQPIQQQQQQQPSAISIDSSNDLFGSGSLLKRDDDLMRLDNDIDLDSWTNSYTTTSSSINNTRGVPNQINPIPPNSIQNHVGNNQQTIPLNINNNLPVATTTTTTTTAAVQVGNNVNGPTVVVPASGTIKNTSPLLAGKKEDQLVVPQSFLTPYKAPTLNNIPTMPDEPYQSPIHGDAGGDIHHHLPHIPLHGALSRESSMTNLSDGSGSSLGIAGTPLMGNSGGISYSGEAKSIHLPFLHGTSAYTPDSSNLMMDLTRQDSQQLLKVSSEDSTVDGLASVYSNMSVSKMDTAPHFHLGKSSPHSLAAKLPYYCPPSYKPIDETSLPYKTKFDYTYVPANSKSQNQTNMVKYSPYTKSSSILNSHNNSPSTTGQQQQPSQTSIQSQPSNLGNQTQQQQPVQPQQQPQPQPQQQLQQQSLQNQKLQQLSQQQQQQNISPYLLSQQSQQQPQQQVIETTDPMDNTMMIVKQNGGQDQSVLMFNNSSALLSFYNSAGSPPLTSTPYQLHNPFQQQQPLQQHQQHDRILTAEELQEIAFVIQYMATSNYDTHQGYSVENSPMTKVTVNRFLGEWMKSFTISSSLFSPSTFYNLTEEITSEAVYSSLNPLSASALVDITARNLFSFSNIIGSIFNSNNNNNNNQNNGGEQDVEMNNDSTIKPLMEPLSIESFSEIEWLPLPKIVVGYKEEWMEIPTTIIKYWDKALIEPYSPKKNISYYVVCPDTPVMKVHIPPFFTDISGIYEINHLGNHHLAQIPSTKQPIGYHYVPISNNYIESYLQTCIKLSGQLKDISLQYNENNCIVVYIINPFTDSSSFDYNLNNISGASGEKPLPTNNNTSPQKQQKESLIFIKNCLKAIMKETFVNNSLNITVQFIPIEQVFLSDSQSMPIVKDIAFSVFNKCRRVSTISPVLNSNTTIQGDWCKRFAEKIYEPLFILSSNQPQQQQQPQYSNLIHCSYMITDNGKWVSCAMTDERGEMLENKLVPVVCQVGGGISWRATVQNVWSFITEISNLLQLTNIKIVIGKFGIISKEEYEEWNLNVNSMNIESQMERYIDFVVFVNLSMHPYLQLFSSESIPSDQFKQPHGLNGEMILPVFSMKGQSYAVYPRTPFIYSYHLDNPLPLSTSIVVTSSLNQHQQIQSSPNTAQQPSSHHHPQQQQQSQQQQQTSHAPQPQTLQHQSVFESKKEWPICYMISIVGYSPKSFILDIQDFSKYLTRSYHRLSYLNLSPRYPDRYSVLPLHFNIIKSMSRMTYNLDDSL